MATKLQKLKWDIHQKKHKMLMIYGLQHGLIFPYDEELIQKLRNVYYGAITQYLYNIKDIDVIQLEINGSFRDLNNDNLERLCNSLMFFIKQYVDYTNC